jgi:hypothetical protein
LLGVLPEQHFFPLPLRQHLMAPPFLPHIFAPFSPQHFISQPFLQHFSPLQVPCLAIGQFAPIGVCGACAKDKAAKTRRKDRNEMVRFMKISFA